MLMRPDMIITGGARMTRTLMTVLAVSCLMLSTALAETTGNPNQGSAMSGANQRGGAGAQVITSQLPSQWLGSELMGIEVIGADSNRIGNVSDVLINKSGAVDALVVRVGGFAGIGGKHVALPISAFEIMPPNIGENTTSSDQLRLSMTKDQLQLHAESRALGEPRATTGSGPAGNSAPE
jgi:hypothetical protein